MLRGDDQSHSRGEVMSVHMVPVHQKCEPTDDELT
jgi:hypothetical protein